jgi:hypothetical protein
MIADVSSFSLKLSLGEFSRGCLGLYNTGEGSSLHYKSFIKLQAEWLKEAKWNCRCHGGLAPGIMWP